MTIMVVEVKANVIAFRDEKGNIVKTVPRDPNKDPKEIIREEIKKGLDVHESLKEYYFPKKK